IWSCRVWPEMGLSDGSRTTGCPPRRVRRSPAPRLAQLHGQGVLPMSRSDCARQTVPSHLYGERSARTGRKRLQPLVRTRGEAGPAACPDGRGNASPEMRHVHGARNGSLRER
ncbi:hypothetical protein PMAYCL1PPCAC_25050, partial [Pristionchus mayeri]